MKIAGISRNPKNAEKIHEKNYFFAKNVNFEADFYNFWVPNHINSCSPIHICARKFVYTSSSAYIYG